jgi:hypothetical protein
MTKLDNEFLEIITTSNLLQCVHTDHTTK